jgi:hypothetical protein
MIRVVQRFVQRLWYMHMRCALTVSGRNDYKPIFEKNEMSLVDESEDGYEWVKGAVD